MKLFLLMDIYRFLFTLFDDIIKYKYWIIYPLVDILLCYGRILYLQLSTVGGNAFE